MSAEDNDESKFERQKLVLEYIRTFVIVGGVIFASVEISNALSARKQAEFEMTAAMLSQFGSEEMIQATSALKEAQSADPNDRNYDSLMARLTPARQHFIVWAACLSEGVCSDGPSREIFCSRVLSYEAAVEQLMARFGRTYDRETRDSQYFGEREKCANDYPKYVL